MDKHVAMRSIAVPAIRVAMDFAMVVVVSCANPSTIPALPTRNAAVTIFV